MSADSLPSPDRHLLWPQDAEAMLEALPGVVSARIVGQELAVKEVEISYEPIRPLSEIAELVKLCLESQTRACLTRTRFRAVLVPPSQRTSPVSAEMKASPGREPDVLRLVSYRVKAPEKKEPPTVEVVLDFRGTAFEGTAAIGTDSLNGFEAPALATVRAIEQCLTAFGTNVDCPVIKLSAAHEVEVERAGVAVVALEAAWDGQVLPLTGASPMEPTAPALAFILATVRAASRTVTRWMDTGRSPSATRFSLLEMAVQRSVSGRSDVGVSLGLLDEAVVRYRRGATDPFEMAAGATVDAVRELLSRVSPNERYLGDLRHTAVSHVHVDTHDLAVVLVEAIVKGMVVPLAGATLATNGLERAAVTAALQATNPFVAQASWQAGVAEA